MAMPVKFQNLDINFSHTIFSSGVPGHGETDSITELDQKVKLPKRYKVILHNDDYSTMEFVIFVLQRVFGKSPEQAHALMLKVHMEGAAVCGIYTFEIAESKTAKVTQLAREHGHPLKCTYEEE
jgi:ATP-dependent Clp protease adaptor protein ClpS